MHPHLSGEQARLRAHDIARDIARHRIPSDPDSIRPHTPSGFLLSMPLRAAGGGTASRRVRHRIGLLLIRAGTRVVGQSTLPGTAVVRR